jgi:hypothetical protein
MSILVKGLVLFVLSFISIVAEAEEDNYVQPQKAIDFDLYVTQDSHSSVVQAISQRSKNISSANPSSTHVLLPKISESISYFPQLYLEAATGTDLVTQEDLLIPLYLTTNNALMLYGQGRYGLKNYESLEENTWLSSGGVLYRQILPKTNSVLGAYVFGDYNKNENGHKYWIISPGLESLGTIWDFHLNGYIPIGKSSWENKTWAQDLGDYSYIQFEEGTNNLYDGIFVVYEETGVGADFEIGRKLFKFGSAIISAHIQGYYYAMAHNDDVIGGGGKIAIQPSRYITFSANHTYDNYQHNTFMLKAQIRLNDLFSKSNRPIDENDLTARLFDPVERGFGNIGNGVSAPTTIGKSFTYLGNKLYSANVVFFADGASGYISKNAAQYIKGTYGNPYDATNDVTIRGMQTILDEVHSNFPEQAIMYFAPGTYEASDNNSSIVLYENMWMLGRDYWYTSQTKGDQRALFIGSMNLSGFNHLGAIRLQNLGEGSTLFATAITVNSADDIWLNNVEIGAQSNDIGYATAITMNNSSALISNSAIYGYQNATATANNQVNAIGIFMTDGGSLEIFDSNIGGTASESESIYNFLGNGYGIYADGLGERIIINNSNIYGSGAIYGGAEYPSYASGNGYGILVGANYLNVSDSSIDATLHDNELIITNSTISGKGYSDLTQTYGQTAFANGFGIFVGYNYINIENSDNENTANLSIYNNKLFIDNNTNIIGSGGINVSDLDYAAISTSGNGFGALVGFNYTYIYNHDGNYQSVDASIYNNEIYMNYSEFTGSGNATMDAIPDDRYSSNGYGLLIGNNYSQYANGSSSTYQKNTINSSIYANTLSMDSSSIKGFGNVSASSIDSSVLSGNGTGIFIGYGSLYKDTNCSYAQDDGSIHDNILKLNDSIIAGNGVYNFSGEQADGYANSLLGSGFGIVIGYSDLEKEGYGDENIDNIAIYDNALSIYGGSISGSGAINASSTDYSVMFGGNGFGVLIGIDSISILNNKGNFQSVDTSIHNNEVYMSYSDVIGSGSINANGAIKDEYNGDGYGLLIGMNYSQHTNGVNSSYQYNTINSSIYANTLNVDSSSIKGSGNVSASSVDSSALSGNGTGLLLGHAYFYNYTNSAYAQDDGSIHDNILKLVSSVVTGNGSYNFSGTLVGSAFGIIIGDEFFHDSSGYQENSVVDSSVENNTISISGGQLIVSNNKDVYGLLLGYSLIGNVTTITDLGTSDNSLIVENAFIKAQSTEAGNAYGIKLLGSSTSTNNNLSASSDSFNMVTNNTAGWGINMLSDSGTLNSDAATVNIFSQSGVVTSTSAAILWPDGTTTSW